MNGRKVPSVITVFTAARVWRHLNKSAIYWEMCHCNIFPPFLYYCPYDSFYG